jgi:hypothetical protein
VPASKAALVPRDLAFLSPRISGFLFAAKITEGKFRSVNDLFHEALRILESHDALKTLQFCDLRAQIADSIALSNGSKM